MVASASRALFSIWEIILGNTLFVLHHSHNPLHYGSVVMATAKHLECEVAGCCREVLNGLWRLPRETKPGVDRRGDVLPYSVLDVKLRNTIIRAKYTHAGFTENIKAICKPTEPFWGSPALTFTEEYHDTYLKDHSIKYDWETRQLTF